VGADFLRPSIGVQHNISTRTESVIGLSLRNQPAARSSSLILPMLFAAGACCACHRSHAI
jgi:hypothetical protein